MSPFRLLGPCLLSLLMLSQLSASTKPIADSKLVFAEKDGLVAVEAEHFFEQSLTDVRAFHLTTKDDRPKLEPDGDPNHVAGASGGAYLELLPDSRRNHGEKLIKGKNFSNEPGKLAMLKYKVRITTPGRYYVWVRAFSSGSEDNGLHVGIDGNWPESGQRLQWCEGKQQWWWESKQRTQKNHCGEAGKIFLDIEEAGEHVIHFSMREDGFEFDKWLMTTDPAFKRPQGLGPQPVVFQGEVPNTFAFVAAEKKPVQVQPSPKPQQQAKKQAYPEHWGNPPMIETRDYRPLPGGYGFGSSTRAAWIQKNLDADKAHLKEGTSPTVNTSESPLILPRKPDGDGSVEITGERKQWHKVTLTLDGPYAHEQDNEPNPFTDIRLTGVFIHPETATTFEVPGYFAADGDAANTSAEAGTKWRVHFAPPHTGLWQYAIMMQRGKHIALDNEKVTAEFEKADIKVDGTFNVAASDKSGRDLRAKGQLKYVGKHYLQFSGSKEYFLKAGADAPETLLGYADFDGTEARRKNVPLKSYEPHLQDWSDGDPTWKEGKGKGLIGAVNYLSGKGCNAFSFLTYNAGGDGDNVWPFIERMDKLHYDCSKLDQWGIVFDHGTAKGMYLHFKMQETEMDDHGKNMVPTSLDGGNLGVQRKLYCRELIARFGHNLALNWNLGEENTQTHEQQVAMIKYIQELDAYGHNIVIHTFPNQQDKVYRPFLENPFENLLTGLSLQNSNIADTHEQVVKWVEASSKAGQPWVVAFDESGSAAHGQCPDLGYKGFDGEDNTGKYIYTEHDVRRQTLWGTLMGGGAGVEYYFGYKFVENDLLCEDWRSRDRSWDYCRIALEFFHENEIPFWEMAPHDELVGQGANKNSSYCLAKPGEVYLVYRANTNPTELDLTGHEGEFSVRWFNPRDGGNLLAAQVKSVTGGGKVSLGIVTDKPVPPEEADWVAIVRRVEN